MPRPDDANEGKMAIGWQAIGDKWYYFGLDGKLWVNTMMPDGKMIDGEGCLVVR